MSDYGKDTDTKQVVAQELLEKLPGLLERYSKGSSGDLAQQVQDLVSDTRADFDDSGIFVPVSDELEAIFAPVRDPYPVSNTFSALNHPDYRVLTDSMVVVGAEANTGKTTFMTALALDMVEHNPEMCALIISLDDGGIMTKKRIVSQLLGEDLMWNHSVPASRLTTKHKEILQRIYVRDSIQLRDIEREARKVKALSKCSRIYIGIDYLQIIPVSVESSGKREGYNDAVKHLKETQKHLAPEGCILMLLSQLNRAGKDDRPDSMNRYRETSEVENQADVAMLMFQMNPDTEDDREVKVKIVKNKKGARGRWWKTKLVKGHRFDTFTQFTPETTKKNGKGPKVDVEKSAKKEAAKASTNTAWGGNDE